MNVMVKAEICFYKPYVNYCLVESCDFSSRVLSAGVKS